jgi:acetyltransferase-like isoleucine patch superfamily enzyme
MLGVQLGSDCRIYTNRFGTEPEFISIGDRVTITSGVIFLTHDGSTWLFRDKKGRRFFYNEIIIGNDVFVGVDSILLPGVHIGDDVIVGAGSVVTKSIPSGCIVGGNPAKIIGKTSDYRERALKTYLDETSLGPKSREWLNGNRPKASLE